jgi:hypothetical protein
MAAIQPSLLMKHFKPDLSEAERATPCRRYVRSGPFVNDPRLQRAADDAMNYFNRYCPFRHDGAAAASARN